MDVDFAVTPRRLSELCEGWTREEIVDAIMRFKEAATINPWYERHVQVLRDELNARDLSSR